MEKNLQYYFDQLNALDFKNMYENDFFFTWNKTDDELKAVWLLADALRYMRQNNISTKVFESGLGISVFRDNSTRTRFSFASACNFLGLQVQDLVEKKSQIAHGETVRETANMVSFMADVIGIRADMYIGKGHEYQKEFSEAVAQGYKDLKERSAIVRFKVKQENAYFLAWTTTPWTLPSNVALCVNPAERYVKVESGDGFVYYMAEALLEKVIGSLGEYKILENYKGSDLKYKEYEPLFPEAKDTIAKQQKRGFFVTCDNYVTLTDGTGVVHIAPAFGEDDSRVGKNYNLPFVQFVNSKGEMTEETAWPGVFCKNADPLVLNDLEKQIQHFSDPYKEHSYPNRLHCDTPIINYAKE